MRRFISPLVITAAAILAGAACARDSEREVVQESLASPAAPGSAEPNLAVGPDDRVYMSWLEPRDSGHAFRFAVLTDTTWSEARTIREGTGFFVNWADFPSLEVLEGDRLAAHRLQRNGEGTYAYGVRIALSGDGGRTWSEPITPHRDSSPTEHGFVAMWREAPGIGAVWLDGRNFAKPTTGPATDAAGHGGGSDDGHGSGSEMMLLSTNVDAAGKVGAEQVLDRRTCDCCQNSAAMTTDGPIVAYRDRSPDEIRDIHVVRRVGERWTEGAPVHRDGWRIDACPVNGPAVSANGRKVAVAWFTAANDTARVKLAFSGDAGATFGAPAIIDDGNPAGRVDVELLKDGSALVTWIERTSEDGAAVRTRRVAPDGVTGASITVAPSSAARASGFPRMAIAGDHVVFAWTVPGTPSEVRIARRALSSLR